MPKQIKRTLLCLILAVCLLSQTVPVFADSSEPFIYVDEARNSNYPGEYVCVKTPEDESFTLYIEGKMQARVTMMRFSLATKDKPTVLRVFVRPDENGEFCVRINTRAGNKDYPTASRGTVVADEKGAGGKQCYDTMPGYKEMPELQNEFCRLMVCCAYTQEQAKGVYSGDWYKSSNPLSGDLGFVSKELVLHMTGNQPHAVVYRNICEHNSTLRSLDDMRAGSRSREVYTDPYLKDIEGYTKSGSATRPLLREQVDYIHQLSVVITTGAGSDYEKLRKIYEFAADNYYYDQLGLKRGYLKQYCNVYECLHRLIYKESSEHSVNGKVGTVCNGYAGIVIALCRAQGIPARMVCGYNGSGFGKFWSSMDPNDYTRKQTHWWAEAYLDAGDGRGPRWVVVDADRGSNNNWNRDLGDLVADDGSWSRSAAISYSGFDMNEEQLAGNYYYNSVSAFGWSASGWDSQPHMEWKSLLEPRPIEVDTSDGYVFLRWDAVADAECYEIWRGTEPEWEKMRPIATVYHTQFTSDGSLGNLPEESDITYYYRVLARHQYFDSGRSELVAVTVSQHERDAATCAPAIISQPLSLSAAAGDDACFAVHAVGPSLRYQWQYRKGDTGDWVNSGMEGSQSDLLTVPAAADRSGYQYRCMVSNAQGTCCSESATLTVEAANAPTLLSQPEDVSVSCGDTAVFQVTAFSDAARFRWQFRSSPDAAWSDASLPGSDSDMLYVDAQDYRDGYQYRCVLSNAGSELPSAAATLHVKGLSRPRLILAPSDCSAALDGTVVFTVRAAGGDLKYQWYRRSGRSGSWEAIQGPNGRGPSLSVIVTPQGNGIQYRCLVHNSLGGFFTQAATLTSLPMRAPVLYSQPRSVHVPEGHTLSFSVGAGGNALSYQWQYRADSTERWRDLDADSAKSSRLYIAADSSRSGWQYRCRVTNVGGSVYSDAAVLTVTTIAAPVITRQTQFSIAGETIVFTVRAAGYDLQYCWQKWNNGEKIWENCSNPGSDTDTCSVALYTDCERDQYRCIIRNEKGSCESEAVTPVLPDVIPPSILAQPKSIAKAEAEPSSFWVTASGSDLRYQWQYLAPGSFEWVDCAKADWAGCDSVTDATFSFESRREYNGYQFRCRVYNAVGGDHELFSDPATLTVTDIS